MKYNNKFELKAMITKIMPVIVAGIIYLKREGDGWYGK